MATAERRNDVPLSRPVTLALCQAVTDVPTANSMSGGARYEPKWDGFRAALFTGDGGTPATLQSRNDKDLSRYFPEVVNAAAQLPAGWVLDGELIVFDAGRLNFPLLQQRLHPAERRAAQLSAQHPATLVIFDVLATAEEDVRAMPYTARRALLTDLFTSPRPGMLLTPMTEDRDEALLWMRAWSEQGMEGLVVKAAAGRYRPGKRDWLKVRTETRYDVIVGGIQGPLSAPKTVIVGLPGSGGRLRVAGMSRPLTAAQSTELASYLAPAGETHPWPDELPPSRTGMLAGAAPGPVRYRKVRPDLVVEIAADSAFEHGKWRHTVIYRRPRPDVPVAEVRSPDGPAAAAGD